jgi:uncharacterized protein with PIN domain
MTFIADKSVGKLVKWLRILGYDTVYCRSDHLEGLLRRARDEGRTLITKDSKLYKGKGSLKALLIREDNPFLQLQEVVRLFRLPVNKAQLFSRCLICNSRLEVADPSEVKEEIPDYIYHTHQAFSRCPSCRKIYWTGTHYEHMVAVVERLQENRS